MVPEFVKGFQIVKHWVQTLIYNVNCDPHELLLTDILRFANLGLFLDPKDAPNHLLRNHFMTSMTSIPRPILLAQHIVSELLTCMAASDPWFLWRGICVVK